MLGLGLGLNKTVGALGRLVRVWILNDDAEAVEGFKYVWIDTENWTDDNIWKD
jgi:hypothetical protein